MRPADGRVGQHPEDPHDDDRCAHGDRGDRVRVCLRPIEVLENRLDLQAHQDEREHVEHEDHDVPDGVRGEAQPRRHRRDRPLRDENGVDDERDDSRQTEPLGGEPHGERRHELDDDRRRRVVHTVDDEGRQASENGPESDAAHGGEREHRHRAPPRELPGHRRGHREPVDEQRAGIVEEALALDDDEHPVRRMDLAQHRACGRRIRGRHDGAEGDRRWPGQRGDDPPGHHGDGGDREPHGDQREARDGAPVSLQVTRGRVVSSVEQDGRHEQGEREPGVEPDAGAVGQERQRRARQGQQRRVWDVNAPCPRREDGAREQQRDDELEDLHAGVYAHS